MPTAFRLIASALVATAVLAQPAFAETIYLKNGALVKGKVVKETEEAFEVESPSLKKVIQVYKVDIEHYPTPSPVVAAGISLMLPGVGHVYTSMFDRAGGYQRAALFLGLTTLGGVAGWQMSQYGVGNLPLNLAVGMGFPTLVSAVDSWEVARHFSDRRKFRIDYTDIEY